jgi:pimeloyl-ACP methyl ester carboxylesterase
MPTFRTNDDVTLSYADQGTGRPVVLVHGYTAPAAAWALISDALLAEGHRVVAFDRRSHGDSETPNHGLRMARHGRDLGELLDHLELTDVTVAGASMGGNTIWAYVDQYGSGRLAGILVDDQTPKMINTPDWPYGFYGYRPENAGTFFAQGIPPSAPERNREPSMPAMMRLIERLGGPPAFRDPSAPETLPLLQDHALADWRDVVARCDKPFVMLAARDSQLWPCEHAEAAVAGNPRGRAVVVEDCGHTVCLDQPDRFVAVLLDLLRSTDPTA